MTGRSSLRGERPHALKTLSSQRLLMSVLNIAPPTRPNGLARAHEAKLPIKKTFKQIQFESRELAILAATNQLLSTKGYEHMAMDDIASAVGIAKGSLYRHFQSKEDLAAAVMLQLLQKTHQTLLSLHSVGTAKSQLQALLKWILLERIHGRVPHLPSASIQLRHALMSHKAYMNALLDFSEVLGAVIVQAKQDGAINAALSDEFVLYYFYSRACDPTLEYLQSGGSMSEVAIVESMLRVTFDGLA
jgi:TetR/AcrR family transcriptional regulator, regulator of autoinduction and epiphytic fitness